MSLVRIHQANWPAYDGWCYDLLVILVGHRMQTQDSDNVVAQRLLDAQAKAKELFQEIERLRLVMPGKTEKYLSDEVFELAYRMFGTKKHWHKRIVRAGKNATLPYSANPPVLAISPDDLIYFDFGPVFDEYEADFGKTYLLGDDANKRRLLVDLTSIFESAKDRYFDEPHMTGSELFSLVTTLAEDRGWKYGNNVAGHLVGRFYHGDECGKSSVNYISPKNMWSMAMPDQHGRKRHWVLEIHLVDPGGCYGGFYEDLLNVACSV